jgi:hypothetical protein
MKHATTRMVFAYWDGLRGERAALRLQRRASLPAWAWAAYRTALAIAVLRIRHNRTR